MVSEGKATMWSHRCSCAPFTSGCYGTDGETKGHGICACSMQGSWSDHTKSYRKVKMTEEKCTEMVDAGNATMYSHKCGGICAETIGCYGTDGVTKGHGVCACHISETECQALVDAGNATMWSFSCDGICVPDPADATTTPEPEGPVVVSASLTFAGLTEADAKTMEDEIIKGIADSIEGVSAADVTITGYTTTAATERRLQDTLVIEFTVAVPAGSTTAAIKDAVQTALDTPATIVTNIKAAVTASTDTAVTALDMTSVDITAVTAPTVIAAPDDPMNSGASLVLFGALAMIYS